MPTSITERDALRHRYDDDGERIGQCEVINNGVGPIRDHCLLCNFRLARIAQERDHEQRVRDETRTADWLD